MPYIRVEHGDVFDKVLKQFKRKCERSGLFSELKKRRHFVKPSEEKRAERLNARKKLLKKLRKEKARMRHYD